MDCEPLLRRYETEVLDAYHREFAVWHRSPDTRLWAILSAFDSFILSRVDAQNRYGQLLPLDLVHRFKTIEEGLNWALRWCFADAPDSFPSTTASDALLDEGGSLLHFTADYFVLADLHQMFGRGAMSLSCSEEARRIRFVPNRSSEILPWHAMGEQALSEERLMRRQVDALSAIAAKLHRVRFEYGGRGHIVLTHSRDLRDSGLLSEVRPLFEESTLPLDETCDLGGVTMDEFRSTWAGVLAWSITVAEIYIHLATEGVPQTFCLPTQVMPVSELVDGLCAMTDLKRPTVQWVIETLTFEPRRARADIFLQPFIMSRDRDRVAWSPQIVRMSRPERNLLKLFAQTPSRSALAANLVGGREHRLAEKFGRLLAQRGGADFKLDRKLSSASGEGQIDLICWWRKHPEDLLLVEAKAILTIDSFHEQLEAAKVFIEAEKQLNRAAVLLAEMATDTKRRLAPFVDWAKVRRVFKLVLTPDTPTVVDWRDRDVASVSLRTATLHFHHRDFASPYRIWSAAKGRLWMDNLREEHLEFRSIHVGPVTYDVPVSVIDG